MAEDEEPEFRATLICKMTNAELDRLIPELGNASSLGKASLQMFRKAANHSI